jgi:flagellar biosynthetic protein FliQ
MEDDTPMDPSLVLDWSHEALRVALVLGAPALLAALAVGVVVGVGQTLMQLHDPVVSLVPRLVAVLVVLMVVLPWMVGLWVSYATELIGSLAGT